MTLLAEVCQQGEALRAQGLTLLLVSSLCFLCELEDVSSQLPAPPSMPGPRAAVPPCHDGLFLLWSQNPK